MAAPLRQIYDQMLEPKWVIAMGACASSGGMFNNYAILQGVDKIVAGRRLRARLPAAARGAVEGIIRLQEKIKAGVPPAVRDPRGRAADAGGRPRARRAQGGARRDDARRRSGALVEACTHLRDEEGFDFLSDITPVDYLGWGGGASPATTAPPPGRDLNARSLTGLARTPDAEADALRGQLPPAARSRGAPRRPRPGLARRRPERARA